MKSAEGQTPIRFLVLNGVVKDEFRAGWERIASAEEGSPTAFIMKMIISEMEATDWTGSQSLR